MFRVLCTAFGVLLMGLGAWLGLAAVMQRDATALILFVPAAVLFGFGRGFARAALDDR